MNTGVFADTVSTDGGDGIKTEDREEGAKAGETVSEETTVSGEEAPEEPAAISSDLAEENSGNLQFLAPKNLRWISETKVIDVGGGKTVNAKGGSIAFDEVNGADTISWWVKKGDTVVVSGDAVYDPNDDINTVIVEDFLWNIQGAGECKYTAYAKTKGRGEYAESDETSSQPWTMTPGARYEKLENVSFNDNGEYGVYFEGFWDSGSGSETPVDGFCIEYSYEDKGEKKVLYYGTYDYNTVNVDDKAARAKVHIEAVKAAKERGIKEVYIRVCSLSYTLYKRSPSEWSDYVKADFTDLIAIYNGIPEKLEIMGNPAKLGIGRSVQLGLRAFPDGIGSFSVSWCSLNPDLASVDQGGKVTGLKEGTAVISVNSVSNPNAVSSCRIEIETVKLQGISFDKQSYEMFPGQTGVTPKIIFDPADAPNKELYFSSSDPEVAEMSGKENRLIAYKSGKATITATSKANPSISANCTVTVSSRGGKIIDSGEESRFKWTFYEGGTLVVEGLQKSIAATKKPWEAYLGEITNLELEGDISAITGSIFYNMPVLRSVTLPNSIQISGKTGFFRGCPMLEELSYPGQQYSVEDGNVLVGQGSSKKMSRAVLIGTKAATGLPGDVDGVGSWAFYGQSLPYIVIPSNVRTLAAGAFEDCAQLSFIVVDNTQLTFEGEPFGGCTNLKDVFFAGNEKEWKKVAAKSSVLRNAEIHYGEKMPELCTVSFNANGGSTVAPLTAIKGKSISTLPETYKDKFVLEGWYLDQALTQPFKAGDTKVEGNLILYAKWRDAKELTVTFYGRLSEDGKTWEVYETRTVYEMMLVDPGTPFYADIEEPFAGWFKDEKLREPFNASTTRIRENLSLYAKFSSLTPAERQTELSDGTDITFDIDYTTSVSYDGRTHLVGEYDGRILKKESTTVNPDIKVENFAVYVNGEQMKGITIKSFAYKNNKLPSYDGADGSNIPMFIYPVLKYDKKDSRLQDLLKSNPNIKKTLNSMMKPSVYKSGEQKGEYNYEPLTVTITRIDLSSVPVYTTKDLKEDTSLKTADGILVWKGGRYKRSTKKIGKGEDATIYYTKTSVPGLYYQRVFNIKGKLKVKKIALRAGGWSIKADKYYDEDEKKYYIEGYHGEINSKAFDYYSEYDDGYSLTLNTDAEKWAKEDKNENILHKVKIGYFEGSLPYIEEESYDE